MANPFASRRSVRYFPERSQPVVPPSTKEQIRTQVNSNVDLSDLELPDLPAVEVVSWGDMQPMRILNHEMLANYVFRWCVPKTREKIGWENWQRVTGDLAEAVRRCGIIPGLVGGDHSVDGLIHNGDAILCYVPAKFAERRKIHYEELNNSIMEGIVNQSDARDKLQVRNRRGVQYLTDDGDIQIYRGRLQPED
jgi:hypothetical protein